MLVSPLRRLLAALVGVVVLVLTWFALQYFPPGGSGREVLITVHRGDSMAVIAGDLHRAGVIASAFTFRVDSFLEGAPLVVPGVYELAQGASYPDIRSILSGGPNVPQVDVVPGVTIKEIALDVANSVGNTFASSFLSAARDAAAASPYHPQGTLDGLVGPGLYLITPGETPAQLLAAMQRGFATEAAQAGLTPASTNEGLDAYQLLTAASIVEKEGYYAKNMPDVARVIYNRLARQMPLQMDSTVLYALGLDGGTVTHAMLQTPTPYNTYLNAGLTPTPICVVSPQALQAVLHPPAGDWLYFVLVKKDGTMAFSATYQEQLAQEAKAAKAGL
ncbi:MAG: endolytic transglycosylase MltG [Acidobacteriota bacterium]|nr:endolytic transglycosylase MltG [Acidobacteriota bacterium]MDE3092293.1 endolytic transglycosylase MltG [Acidobacteriota bacterium]MDE3138871.1 endolytic transglycosylase MltG [Acidobacteriota bacterium]MDE3146095.1 endolytic transglycosylase MltG [Acidobacteriota bacterium]